MPIKPIAPRVKKPRASKIPKDQRPAPDEFVPETLFLSDDPVVRNAAATPEAREEMSREQKLQRLNLLSEQKARSRRRKMYSYYPDTGPLRRELYVKHMKFFAAGKHHRQRLMLAANRIGKTEGVGLYELTLHATGQYPDWWEGRRFLRPIKAWACAVTQQKVREILQDKLLGPVGHWGEGLLPHDTIVKVTAGGGVADSVSVIYVANKYGGVSQIEFKSYEQGRKGFEGTEQDVILEDEEPPLSIHTECLIRTMTNDGIMMLTFTPLQGMSEVVLDFLKAAPLGFRYHRLHPDKLKHHHEAEEKEDISGGKSRDHHRENSGQQCRKHPVGGASEGHSFRAVAVRENLRNKYPDHRALTHCMGSDEGKDADRDNGVVMREKRPRRHTQGGDVPERTDIEERAATHPVNQPESHECEDQIGDADADGLEKCRLLAEPCHLEDTRSEVEHRIDAGELVEERDEKGQ